MVFRTGGESLVVLGLSANPDPSSPLNVEKEQARIAKVRDGSRYQNKVRIEYLPDLDLPALPKSLRLHAPVVVHFSGHGAPDGSLLMKDENGTAYEMHPKGLADILLLQRKTIRLVVLNACYSAELAETLVEHVEAVVGMIDRISDDAAILFSQTFYGALFDGTSVGDAFDTSKAALQARYHGEGNTPLLRARAGVDLAQIVLID
jgi:hypothetical protein